MLVAKDFRHNKDIWDGVIRLIITGMRASIVEEVFCSPDVTIGIIRTIAKKNGFTYVPKKGRRAASSQFVNDAQRLHATVFLKKYDKYLRYLGDKPDWKIFLEAYENYSSNTLPKQEFMLSSELAWEYVLKFVQRGGGDVERHTLQLGECNDGHHVAFFSNEMPNLVCPLCKPVARQRGATDKSTKSTKLSLVSREDNSQGITAKSRKVASAS